MVGDPGVLADRTSVEPALRLLERYEQTPYQHRDVATKAESKWYLKKYLKKYLTKTFATHPILYLGFHGWGPSKGKDAYLEIGDGTPHTVRKARTLDRRQMKRARDSLRRVWRHERRRYSVGLICEEYQCPCHLWIPQGGRLVGLRCVRQEATRGDIERSLISTYRPSMNAKGRLLREALRQFGRGWSVSRLRPTSSLRLYRVVQGARDP